MTKSEAGSLGGKATALLHGIEFCDLCGQMLPLTFHQRIGKLGNKTNGGNATKKKHGIEFYRECGKKGRGISRIRR